ncbi:aspartic peptidase domain-containing protein [Chytridium lagenaria]|nr:aspartic peptidase domain-containing protein [Chytridium lagenaria]
MQLGKALGLVAAALTNSDNSTLPVTPSASPPVTLEIQRNAHLNLAGGHFLEQAVMLPTMRFAGFQPGRGVSVPPALSLEKRQSVELVNYMNLLYAAPITLGNGQRFNVHIDTGSADTWLRGPFCRSRDQSCTGTSVDVNDASITSTNAPFNVVYGSGRVAGTVYRGVVSAGGLSTRPIGFGVSTFAEGFDDNGYSDGLLGLAYPAISQIGRALAARGGNAAESGFFDGLGFPAGRRRFGVYLSNAENGDKGELTLGGDNPARYSGPLTCHPLIEPTFWAFSLASSTFTVGSTQGSLGGALNYAIADTGTTLAILDDRVAADLNRAIGATYERRYGVYTIDCSAQSPNVVLRFGGMRFIGGASGGSLAIFGDTFLRAYYSIYDKDNSRVCFARANHG